MQTTNKETAQYVTPTYNFETLMKILEVAVAYIKKLGADEFGITIGDYDVSITKRA